MQLGQEISGKVPTKAQENWEGWGRSCGTVTAPVRGRPPQSWFNWRKHTDSFYKIKSVFPPGHIHTCRDACLLCSWFDNKQILSCQSDKYSITYLLTNDQEIQYWWGDRMPSSDKMREVKQEKKTFPEWEYKPWQCPGINYFWFALLFMFVFAEFWVNMLYHILRFQHDAFTITGRDQLGTIKERLYIIFPGKRHYKLCQLANGRKSWHGCEEKQRQ